MLELDRAQAQWETLQRHAAAAVLESRLQRAAQEDWTSVAFLADLLEAEVQERRRRSIPMQGRRARLPYPKTWEDVDFGFQPSIDRRLMEELATLGFIDRAYHVLLLGPPGVGKSHLAVALALRALQTGISAYFVTVRERVADLPHAQAELAFSRRMRQYLRPKLLIIDEMGYWPLGREEANGFFHLVNARYERGSIIITSNQNFTEWGELLGDAVLASAVLDRL